MARAFCDLYRTNRQEFPPECAEADFEKRLRVAYPIHPEVFERLYSDWSTLQSFQRTRGVLRLMAAVIHSLWEKGDRNPLILPANVPLDDSRVQFELTRYLPDNWVPVIERDIDGANSLPLRLDGEVPNLGRYSACRRVARAIYLGSAPIPAAANQGVEDRRMPFQESLPLCSGTRCDGLEVPPRTCTRMELATGTRLSRPSPILPRVGQRNTGGIATRWTKR